MVFGEINEPSSRALWDDDFSDYSANAGPKLEWKGHANVPEVVNKLLIGETSRVLNIVDKCVLQEINSKQVCQIVECKIKIYAIHDNSYIITYKSHSDVIVGRITTMLAPWLNVAKHVYILTSSPISFLQNCTVNENTLCIIRSLSAKVPDKNYSRLEVPNLVTSLSASILSYCIHTNLNCTLYVGFMEEVPLDSLNTREFIKLLNYLGVTTRRDFVLEINSPSSHLYM